MINLKTNFSWTCIIVCRDEIQELEERDNLILEIREEIISKTLDICYESYLKKQVIKFNVHCAYHAWLKLLSVSIIAIQNYFFTTLQFFSYWA